MIDETIDNSPDYNWWISESELNCPIDYEIVERNDREKNDRYTLWSECLYNQNQSKSSLSVIVLFSNVIFCVKRSIWCELFFPRPIDIWRRLWKAPSYKPVDIFGVNSDRLFCLIWIRHVSIVGTTVLIWCDLFFPRHIDTWREIWKAPSYKPVDMFGVNTDQLFITNASNCL